eukprot:CAMPEP_0183299506 /NCGR_PEP_ID=MMETSP0160_2-20130417/6227_1 /TAXON_ID=2839 ORGANISM="Odontella Sinensis, Strain Grunow 1884" /NCGR_SAMPLE_ID=MMETSP0160_2 /ASSEMBLY_ACC=CAM_ASM_000250 /LENGTH=76 /DNA_ID=CAMNT_0025461761 /DNA_START=130 /DNA_END=357 /DNA_ORIENTATION=-
MGAEVTQGEPCTENECPPEFKVRAFPVNPNIVPSAGEPPVQGAANAAQIVGAVGGRSVPAGSMSADSVLPRATVRG